MSQPYHKSIIPVLVTVMNSVALSTLGLLIIDTDIPDNHNEVLAAWRTAYARVYGNNFDVACSIAAKRDFTLVVSHIAAEKERVAKEAAAKAAAPIQTEGDVPVCDHCHRKMFLAGKTYRCDCITHH